MNEMDDSKSEGTMILSCGCRTKYQGFPSEWDAYTRSHEPAIAYGSLCEKHFQEYDARPQQYGTKQ